MTGVRALVKKVVGARCVPVPEFLAARERGDLATERAFFEGLLLHNGVYKTTEAHRMDALLPVLGDALARVPGERPRVLDVACSSGVTTVEMHEAFRARGLAVDTTGTDLALDADHVARDDGAAMLFDSAGRLLQVELGDWASPWCWRRRDRVLRPGRVARARTLVARARESFLAARTEPVPTMRARRFRLLSSRAEQAREVRFREEDVLAPAGGETFALVRAANLLNRDYFSADELRRMVAALRARVMSGGLLFLVRSIGSPPVHHGTLFRREGERLVPIERVGDGSEIAALVQ